MDNGRVCPRMRKTPSFMTEFFPFAVMGSQAGLCEQQSALRRLDGETVAKSYLLDLIPALSHMYLIVVTNTGVFIIERTTYIKMICTSYIS